MVLRTTAARRQLDARFERLRPLLQERRPPRGWVRAVRDALGMSTAELAKRMGVAQTRISAIERGEAEGTIKVDTLRRAADALDCDLVYVFVPRTTLDEAVQAQARRKATAHLRRVAHTMRLEDQAVDSSDRQVDDLAADQNDRRGLWTDAET
ncbi:MAG: HTH-Family Transcriptional Regulator [Actinomycetia bacterium]|nr:HTH-Family Transcriptional Regulator [Actinomycetes bacterium]